MRDHQTDAFELRDLGRVTLELREQEHLHRRGNGILAHDGLERVEIHAFAVATGAVEEPELVLAREPGEAITGEAFEERNQLLVLFGHHAEKIAPKRMRRARRCEITDGPLGHVV